MPASYEITLLERHLCADDVLHLVLERPDGYEFKAGQWFRLTLQTAEGPQTKTFSHASAPADPRVEMATRLSSSAFKRAMVDLVPGDTVTMLGPGGRFLLPEEADNVVFLVGGVGITPVRSVLRDMANRGRRFSDAVLVYGNRDESCEPFLDELSALRGLGLRIVRVLERPPAGWGGETGFITAEMVSRHAGAAGSGLYVIAGPPVMVTAMNQVLDELDVAVDRRLVESFGKLGG